MEGEGGYNPPEAVQPIPQPEVVPQPRAEHGIFLSGTFGTYKGIEGIRHAMQSHFGEDNATVFNSGISFDTPDLGRFEKIAGVIATHSGEGKKAHVVAHSSGASEFANAMKVLRENDPDAYEKLTPENFEVTLISPYGFIDTKNALNYLGRLAKYTHEHLSFPIISKHETALRGIDSINLLVPQNIDPGELAESIRDAMSDVAQYDGGYQEVTFEPHTEYEEHIPQEVRQKVALLDEALAAAVAQRNSAGVKTLLEKRGGLLEKHINQAYAGDYFEDITPHETDSFSWTGQAALGIADMLKDIVISGDPRSEVEALQQKGIDPNFLVPQLDVLFPFSDVEKVFGDPDKAKQHIATMQTTAHASIAIHPQTLGKGLGTLRDMKAAA